MFLFGALSGVWKNQTGCGNDGDRKLEDQGMVATFSRDDHMGYHAFPRVGYMTRMGMAREEQLSDEQANEPRNPVHTGGLSQTF